MKLFVITTNTFREAIRNKVFYTLLFFAVLFAALAVSLSTMTLTKQTHIIIDMGFLTVELFGTLIAIFVGINLVYKELERRTIYTILTRPIRRYQFIVGKYLGLLLTLGVEVAFMSAIFFAIVSAFGEYHRLPALSLAVWLIFMKISLVTAVAVFFSSLSSSILSGMFTLAFYLIGSTSGYLRDLVSNSSPPFLGAMIRLINFVLPDFRFLDIKGAVLYEKPVPFSQVADATAYAAFYITLVLMIAILIFERKDMK